MPMPTGLGVIDLMVGIPDGSREEWYAFLQPALKDAESRTFHFPAQYLFHDVPDDPMGADWTAYVLAELDRHGIERAMIGWSGDGGASDRALAEHPDRFFGSVFVDPNQGMDAVRHIRRAVDAGVKAVELFPAGYVPQVPINDKRMYPVYAVCAELGLAVTVTAGVPGPRVPYECQHPGLVDEVCYHFPELTVVLKHGCEPWVDLAVKLLLKWPNLYYATSAFAPKHYPAEIVRYANTRGADKVLYAGYFPMGLSLERIFRELPGVGFRDDVWPRFLRENAIRVFGL